MEWRTEEREDLAIVAPLGDLDAGTAPDLQREFDRLLEKGVHFFVVDLGQVGFIDSVGLAQLIRLYKRVRIGEGDVRLAAMPQHVQPVFKLTRLDQVFDIFESSAEAAESLGGRA